VVRELTPLVDMTMSILSERRVLQPYGLYGGEGGATGVNTIVRNGGEGKGVRVNIGGKSSCEMSSGDVLRIETPGGGGWGKKGMAGSKRKLEGEGGGGVNYVSGQGSLGAANAMSTSA